MAYLKGGTYVDGNLYVEDALWVQRVKTESGSNFPYFVSASGIQNQNIPQNALLRAADNSGGITTLPLKITDEVCEVKSKGSSWEDKIASGKNMFKIAAINNPDDWYYMISPSNKHVVVENTTPIMLIESSNKPPRWIFTS